ncbi:MAG: ornithine cyclodeaminase family protein [Planctomycetota bacterium]
MNTHPLLYLSGDDIRNALPMPQAIEAMREAFSQLFRGHVTLPVRQCVPASRTQGINLLMPCYSAASRRFALKTVTVFDNNPRRGLPRVQGLVILTDGETGAHLAILEGTNLTAIRTGAVSGLATDLLAPVDAAVVAVFGAGVQARTQLEAVCCVRHIERANVYDLDQGAANRFAREMSHQLNVPVARAETPASNMSGADVVCTATSSRQPVFTDQELPARVHINAVGAYTPDMAEIPAATVRRARVVVDHFPSALEEAGDLLQPLQKGLIETSHFRAELGELAGRGLPGRNRGEDITLFKSVGVAIQDLCAAETALENAHQHGLGVPLQ